MSFEGVLNTLDEIAPNNTVGVCAHTRPDGDAVGATLGLVAALRAAGINAQPLLADEKSAPETYSWLEHFNAYAQPSQAPAYFDYLFILDTPTLSRLNEGAGYLHKAHTIVLIDHHMRGDIPAAECLVDTTASATAQLVWKLIANSRFETSQAVAQACFVGLSTDTGSFQHSNTTPEALRDAAEMVAAGASVQETANRICFSKSAAALALEQRILKRLTVDDDGTIAYSYVTDEDFSSTGALRSEGENLVELVRSVKGVAVAILFTQSARDTRISLRAKTDVNVAKVAQALGGGGHKAAAGCTWSQSDTTFEEIVEQVVTMVKNQIGSSHYDG